MDTYLNEHAQKVNTQSGGWVWTVDTIKVWLKPTEEMLDKYLENMNSYMSDTKDVNVKNVIMVSFHKRNIVVSRYYQCLANYIRFHIIQCLALYENLILLKLMIAHLTI